MNNIDVKLTDENVNQLVMMINKDLCDEIDRKNKQLDDVKSYIKQSDLNKMLWGKELMKILDKEEK